MKKLILAFFIIFVSTSLAFSDQFIIPYSCWPAELQREFKNYGFKLDLTGDPRTKDSFGYILNQGDKYTIFTYKSATSEEMAVILEITQQIERWSMEAEWRRNE